MFGKLIMPALAHFGINDDSMSVAGTSTTVHPTVIVAGLLGLLIIATIGFQFYYQAKRKSLPK